MKKRDPNPPDAAPPAAAPRDLVLVGDRVSESGGYRVLRQRDDKVEVGELRALEEGKSITGEIVRLHPTQTHERVFECETLHDTQAPAALTPGPRQVATNTYRRNWEQIFGAVAKTAEGDGKRDKSKLN